MSRSTIWLLLSLCSGLPVALFEGNVYAGIAVYSGILASGFALLLHYITNET